VVSLVGGVGFRPPKKRVNELYSDSIRTPRSKEDSCIKITKANTSTIVNILREWGDGGQGDAEK